MNDTENRGLALESESQEPSILVSGNDLGSADRGGEEDGRAKRPVEEQEVLRDGGSAGGTTAEDQADDEVVGTIPTDESGYLSPESISGDVHGDSGPSGTVVVQDYDPADPGAEIAEPQKVLRPHDRIARKRDRGSRE